MTKLISILSGKAIIVELPERANPLKLFNDERPYLSFFVSAETPRLYLPPGNWRIIGMLSEVTEEQAAGMVEGGEIPFDETANAYRNYSYKSEWGAMWLSTALEYLDI